VDVALASIRREYSGSDLYRRQIKVLNGNEDCRGTWESARFEETEIEAESREWGEVLARDCQPLPTS